MKKFIKIIILFLIINLHFLTLIIIPATAETLDFDAVSSKIKSDISQITAHLKRLVYIKEDLLSELDLYEKADKTDEDRKNIRDIQLIMQLLTAYSAQLEEQIEVLGLLDNIEPAFKISFCKERLSALLNTDEAIKRSCHKIQKISGDITNNNALSIINRSTNVFLSEKALIDDCINILNNFTGQASP